MVPKKPKAAKVDVCKVCWGSGMEIVPEKGARVCVCRYDKISAALFAKSVASRPNGELGEWDYLTDGFNSIHANDRAMARLEKIEGVMDGSSIGTGVKLLDRLQQMSSASFYIYGPTGNYKTTIALALMQEAGRHGQFTAYDIGRELIDTIRNFEVDNRIRPSKQFYSLSQLETTDRKFCLVLDEIEDTASGLTAYTLSTIFRMVEKFKSYKQQLIITSNRNLASLLEVWEYRDSHILKHGAMAEDYCPKIDRRIQELCHVLELRDKG